MRYGITYKGSKNRMAKRIVELLPPAETLVDLFAGGCADIKIGLRTLEDLLDLQRLLGRSMVLIDDYTIQILDTALTDTFYREGGL